MGGGPRRLTFLTRSGCSLCEQGLDLVVRAARLRRVDVEVVDVDGDPDLVEPYGDRVPVILSDDGEVLAEGRISKADALRAVKVSRG
jgi:hypothetical protein